MRTLPKLMTPDGETDPATEPATGPTDDSGADRAPTEDPRPDGLHRADSLVVVNTGNGKGKSSSAFGMMIRAVGRGWNVAVVQFIKSGNWNTGEEKIARQLGVDWHAFGDGFTWDSDDLTNDRAHAAEGWATALGIMNAGEHQLVIFDELTYLSSFNWLDASVIATAISQRPRHVNVIVTGRDAAPELIEVADTVTEMLEVKHAYQQGVRAMRGIDY
ncbi:MAG: cob(I)yrinic acid a,c-diamide adenosyltransferase [Ilumatobacteraceae bacterium]